MAQYPTTIVTTTNIPSPIPGNTLLVNNHSTLHDSMRDEIIAIETKSMTHKNVMMTRMKKEVLMQRALSEVVKEVVIELAREVAKKAM